MKIDFKNFSYKLINHNQYSPQFIEEKKLLSGKEHIRYEFDFKEDNKGFYIITKSEIYIPLIPSGFRLFSGEMTFLIPYEQPIDKIDDNLKAIDGSVRAEFLFYHLCRQSSIIYADTFNGTGIGYNIDVPTLYRLYKEDLSE